MKYSRDKIHELATYGYLSARKNIRNHFHPLKFELRLEKTIYEIANDLYRREYIPRPFECFMIYDPTLREVFAPNIDDALESHILFSQIDPLFERVFIYDSYSCRKGKGAQFGIERFEHHIRSCTQNYTRPAYILNIDISGYFMSINKGILYSIICEHFAKFRRSQLHRNTSTTWDEVLDFNFLDYLVRLELFSNPLENCRIIGNMSLRGILPPNKSMWHSPIGTGVTIGRVTNQLNSNIYLNEYDQYVKRTLHCKNYGRYVDDARILSADIHFLEDVRDASAEFLKERLKLVVHPKKTNIISTEETALFLGGAFRNYRRYASDNTVRRFKEKIKICEELVCSRNCNIDSVLSSLNSYLGHLQHFKERKLIRMSLSGSPLNEIFDFEKYNYRKATIKKDSI